MKQPFTFLSIHPATHPSSYQSFTFPDNQSITQSIAQPLNHTVSQPISSSVNQSMTYDLQIGVQRVWRRAVSSPRIMVWHFPSQICSVASVPTTSTRSCTVFFKTSKFRPPNTVQETKCGIKGSALSSKAHLSPENIFTFCMCVHPYLQIVSHGLVD